jgi:hypothetical protein
MAIQPISALNATARLTPVLMLALLIGSPAAAAPVAGVNQQAAIDKCHAIHREQTRTCRPGTGYAPCMTMYNEKLQSCLADANTITTLDGGGSSGTSSTKPPKVDSPPASRY